MRESYVSKRVMGLKPSGIRKFFDIAATMKDVISLGIGEPDFNSPPPVIAAGIHSLEHGDTHYTGNAGLPELRQALSAHLDLHYKVSYDPASELAITVGGSEALYLAIMSAIDPGDEIIIPTPCFVSYQGQVLMAGGVPVEVPCHFENNFDIEPEAIAAAVTPRTRAILLGFPNNPTGAVASRDRLLQVAQIAEEHDLLVISDEIYDRLVYGVEHVCFAALPGMRRRTMLLGGFSKDYAMTGWRIGYAAAPAAIMTGLIRVHQYLIMCAPTMSQWAAVAAIQQGEEYVQEMVQEYDRRRKMFVKGLNEIGLPTFEPRGAFYAFPKISQTGLDDEAFSMRLLQEEHVACVPGNSFGLGGAGFLRCSYATSYEKLEQALEHMRRFVNRL